MDFRPIDIDQVPWFRRLLLPLRLPASRLLRAIWRRSGASKSTWFDCRLWRTVWNINRLFWCTPRQKAASVEVQFTPRVRMSLDLSRLTDVLALCYGIGEIEVGFVCSRLCDRNSTIVDVGGNIGTTALAFAELVPEGSVHVFEPSAEMLVALGTNIALSRLNNVIVHPHGLSDVPGHAHLEVAISGNPGSAYAVEDEAGGEIEMRTLDEVLGSQTRVDLLKIDVEGLELKVLRGGEELITRHRPVILFEINDRALRRGNTSGEEICAHLELLGYRLFYVDRGRFRHYLPAMARRKLHNALAVHPRGPGWGRLPDR